MTDLLTPRHTPIGGARDGETVAPEDAGGRAGRRVLSIWRVRTVFDVVALVIPLVVVDDGAHGVALVPVILAFLAMIGANRRRLRLSVVDDFGLLVRAVASGLLAVGLALLAGDSGDGRKLIAQATMSLAALAIGRTCSYALIRLWRRRGWLQSRAVVVGAGAVGLEIISLLERHPEYGLEAVGLVDDVVDLPGPGHNLLGGIDDLERVVTAHRISRVIVAFGPVGEQELVETLRAAAHLPVEVYVVPRFYELGLAPVGPGSDEIWGIPLIPVRRAALQADAWFIKRLVDVIVSGTALLVLSPLLGALALAVKVSSPGPILFRQRRIGQHGREIDVLKFRSMRVNDDSDTQWTVAEDPRLTKLGRLMRRTSLDELPQLWNVFRGDMSLIGPRPERPHFVDQYAVEIRGYRDRHRLPVGLTGLAQVHGLRGDTSIYERARFDNFYIEHWSPLLDAKIVARTATAVVRDALDSGRPSNPTPPGPRTVRQDPGARDDTHPDDVPPV